MREGVAGRGGLAMGNNLSAAEAFESVDADGDGQLDFNEIQAAAKKAGHNVHDAMVRKWITEHDVDADEKLNKEEFASLLRDLHLLGEEEPSAEPAAQLQRDGGGDPLGIARPPNVELDIEHDLDVGASSGAGKAESTWGRGSARASAPQRELEDDENDQEDADDEDEKKPAKGEQAPDETEEEADEGNLVRYTKTKLSESAVEAQGGLTGDTLELEPPPPAMVLSLLLLAMQKLGMVLSVPAALKVLPELWVKYFGWLMFFNVSFDFYIPDIGVANLGSFVGQLSILPAVTMLFATSVRTGATQQPSERDLAHMQRLTPHGCLIVSWCYTMLAPAFATLALVWATILGGLCASLAVPVALRFSLVGNTHPVVVRHVTRELSRVIWFVWALCVHAPRALGLMDQEQEMEWYQRACKVLRMLPPSFRAPPSTLYRPTRWMQKLVAGERVRWRDRQTERLQVSQIRKDVVECYFSKQGLKEAASDNASAVEAAATTAKAVASVATVLGRKNPQAIQKLLDKFAYSTQAAVCEASVCPLVLFQRRSHEYDYPIPAPCGAFKRMIARNGRHPHRNCGPGFAKHRCPSLTARSSPIAFAGCMRRSGRRSGRAASSSQSRITQALQSRTPRTMVMSRTALTMTALTLRRTRRTHIRLRSFSTTRKMTKESFQCMPSLMAPRKRLWSKHRSMRLMMCSGAPRRGCRSKSCSNLDHSTLRLSGLRRMRKTASG